MALYKGYSSFEFQNKKTFRLNDIDLVKMDLLNHIFTRRGERVMMQNFGSIIPDIVFEPLDDESLDTIEQDLTKIVDFDPRVELLEFTLLPYFDENRVEAHMELLFVEFDLVDNMDLNIVFEGI